MSVIGDSKTFLLALAAGVIPSLIWLWFWLKEDHKKLESKGLLFLCFIAGMLAVLVVLPIQRWIQHATDSTQLQIIGWAAVEEIFKYLAAALVLWKTTTIDEPVEWPIYLITAALGFAALENTLFLLKPIGLHQATVGLLTGQLRFLGSTLLHSISSGTVGIALGLGFYYGAFRKRVHLLGGLLVAIALHSVFNFFIMNTDGSDFLKVFGFLWVVTIIVMLLFEKLIRMSPEPETEPQN